MSISITNQLTDIRSLVTFSRLNTDIATILQRLETGFRINSGKDDPAGLLARDNMRAEIKGIESAQKNTTQANGMLTAAESGMGMISQLLTGNIDDPDDTGLIGLIYDDSMSAQEKKQRVNDILDMVDYVTRSTTYNGKQLLAGSLEYRTAGLDDRQISRLRIPQAVVRSQSGLPVSIQVVRQAEKGTLFLDQAKIGEAAGVTLRFSGGPEGKETRIHLAAGATTDEILQAINSSSDKSGVTARAEEGLTNHQLVVGGIGDDNDIVFTVNDTVENEGRSYQVLIGASGALGTENFGVTKAGPGPEGLETFVIAYNSTGMSGLDITAGALVDYLNNSDDATVRELREAMTVGLVAGQYGTGNVSGAYISATHGDADSGSGLQFLGAADATRIRILGGGDAPTDANQALQVVRGITPSVDDDVLYIQLATDAEGNVTTTAAELVEYMNTTDGLDTGGISVSLLRPDGQSYSTKNSPAAGYGLVTPTQDAGGHPVLLELLGTNNKAIEATSRGATRIVFETVDEGADRIVTLQDVSDRPGVAIVNEKGEAASTDAGSDMIARVNGMEATSKGRNLNYTSSDLSLSAEISSLVRSGETVSFTITGGGATFQLGKNVRSNMQLKMGIPSVNSNHLGGPTGILSELRDLDFDSDPDKEKAFKIANEAITDIANQRAWIGTLQKFVLDTNGESLDEELVAVSGAEAAISNTDYALESSRLAQKEILAQNTVNTIAYNRALMQMIIGMIF